MKQLLLLMLFTTNAHAEICKNNITNQFNSTYTIDNDKLIFTLKRKDNKPFIFYKLGFGPGFTTSYSFVDKTKLNEKNIKPTIWSFKSEQLKQKIDKQIIDFFGGDNDLISYFFNPLSRSSMYVYPLREEPTQIILVHKEEINLKKFINHTKPIIPEDKKYQENSIYFTFKFIHDPYMKNCTIFKTQQFNYRFGGKWDYVKDRINTFYKEEL